MSADKITGFLRTTDPLSTAYRLKNLNVEYQKGKGVGGLHLQECVHTRTHLVNKHNVFANHIP